MLPHALFQKLISKQNNEEHNDLHRDHGHKGQEEFPSHFPQSDTLYPSLWQPTSLCYFNCEIHEHSLTLLIVLMCTEGLVAAMRTDLLPWSHHGALVQNTIIHLNHELESFSAGSSEIESRQPKVTPSTARGPSPLSCSSGLLPVSNGTCCTSFCSLILLSPITLSSEPRRKAHLLTPSVAYHSLGLLLCTPKGGHMDLSG